MVGAAGFDTLRCCRRRDRRQADVRWTSAFSFSNPLLCFDQKERPPLQVVFLFGRSSGIRTRGLLDPNQARYQTSPCPDSSNIIMEKFGDVKGQPVHFPISAEYFEAGGVSMAYCIEYEGENGERKGSSAVRRFFLSSCMLAFFGYLVSKYWPEGVAVLKQALLPEDTLKTAEVFAQELNCGFSVSDAVRNFLASLIGNGSSG